MELTIKEIFEKFISLTLSELVFFIISVPLSLFFFYLIYLIFSNTIGRLFISWEKKAEDPESSFHWGCLPLYLMFGSMFLGGLYLYLISRGYL